MDFDQPQRTAINLAGTVALPSGQPATGKVALRLSWADGQAVFYVKVVQVVGKRRIFTWFVRREDVRAIETPAGQDPKTAPGDQGPKPAPGVLLPAQFNARLDEVQKQLAAEQKGAGIELEAELYPAAVVYVPEAAPVLFRDESGVTAAESVEEAALSTTRGGCCHPFFKKDYDPGAPSW